MGKTVIREEIFPEIIDCYNIEGKTGAYGLIQSKYGLKQPYSVINRIKKSGSYSYNAETDQFTSAQKDAVNDVFMDLDELCRPAVIKPNEPADGVVKGRAAALEKLIHELVSDRLLILSRYITLDTSTRTILIDQSSLSADGYRVVAH